MQSVTELNVQFSHYEFHREMEIPQPTLFYCTEEWLSLEAFLMGGIARGGVASRGCFYVYCKTR